MAKTDPAKFHDAMDAALDKYVKQQGRNTVALNAERDAACAGYARIPGPDACDFCVTMGAANDFYRTLDTAGGGEGHGTADDRYHPYCKCEVCVVFRKGGRLVARDPATGKPVDYDGAEMIRRYEAIGRPTYSSGEGGSHAARLSWKDAERHAARLESASSADELRAIGAEVERAVPAAAKQSAQWKSLQRTAQRKMRELEDVTALMPVHFGKSLSAAAYRPKIMLYREADGRKIYARFAQDSDLTGIKQIAGKGTGRKIHNAKGITEDVKRIKKIYVNPSEWKQYRGRAMVEFPDGAVHECEIHWFYSKQTGKIKYHMKRDFDDPITRY